MPLIQIGTPRLPEAQVCSLRRAQVCWKLTFTRLHHSSLPSEQGASFLKTSAKLSPVSHPLYFLLAFEYSGDGVPKDEHRGRAHVWMAVKRRHDCRRPNLVGRSIAWIPVALHSSIFEGFGGSYLLECVCRICQ